MDFPYLSAVPQAETWPSHKRMELGNDFPRFAVKKRAFEM